jgi:DNA-binding transcriptional regulator GbsR (MarR family)
MMGWPTDADIERHRINEAEREIHRAEENTNPQCEVDEEATKYARLIAAAPDLYEALEKLVNTVEDARLSKGIFDAVLKARLVTAVAALRKARGE